MDHRFCDLAWLEYGGFLQRHDGQTVLFDSAENPLGSLFPNRAPYGAVILFHLQSGQSDIFVLALVVLGLVLLSWNQEIRSGIVIGLSVLIKIVNDRLSLGFWRGEVHGS